MAETTGISWTRSTFNPWIGCTKIGPGCDACYAETLDKRHKWGGATHWGAGVPRFRTSAGNWKKPLKWNEQARIQRESGELWAGRPGYWPVFCASLADVFDNEVPPEWLVDLFYLIRETPNLEWLLLTKRIGNVALVIKWLEQLSNVRLMITVVNQEEADRDIPKLLALPCKNGISYEPALGPVNFGPYLPRDKIFSMLPGFKDPMGGVQWIIIGGESAQGGHQARPFSIKWARSTIAQCKVAGVPVFMKQMGSNAYMPRDAAGVFVPDYEYHFKDRAGADPTEWPQDINVREFPL